MDITVPRSMKQETLPSILLEGGAVEFVLKNSEVPCVVVVIISLGLPS